MKLRVELRKKGLEAVVFLDEGPFDPAAAAPAVREQLAALGVREAPPREALLEALAPLAAPNPPPDGVVVARGDPPQAGISARIVPSFPIHDTPAAEETDSFSTYPQNVVYPGDTLIQKTPSSPGIAGRSLLGTPIPALQGSDVAVQAGPGVLVEADGCLYRATAYGVVLFQRGQLRVAEALRVESDRMQARLTVLPDPRLDEAAHASRLMAVLTAAEVTHGIDQEALARAVQLARSTGQPVPDVVVAVGKSPVDGREVGYRLLIDAEKKIGTLLDGDRIDFREAETVKNIRRGEPLAEIIPAIEPVTGFRIDGNPLRAQLQRAQGPKPGQNTATSEDGKHIVADADGMVILKGDRFHVMDAYYVTTDVDYRTGNIRASGTVHIRGQVKPGFRVEAGMDAEILQDVEEAVVEAGGNLRIAGGVMGGSRVSAGKSLAAKYLLNCHAEAGEDVEVRLSITKSQVYAKGRVLVQGSQGAIIGGEINAARGIEARTVGSPSAKTHVAVGIDLRVVRELEDIDKETTAAAEEMTRLQSSLSRDFLRDPRAAIEALPPAMRKPKLDVLMRMKALYQRTGELQARRQELEDLNKGLQEAQVSVQGEIHAGTVVTVCRASLTLTESQRRVVFYYDPAQRRVVSRRL